MLLLFTFISQLLAQDLKLSGWVSCGDWACSAPIQEGIARLNFIGVKTAEDVDWLLIRSGETLVVTGKDAGTFKGQQLLCGYIKGKEAEKGFGLFPNSVIRVLRDKMSSLGARRYWTDLQNEKRMVKNGEVPASQPEVPEPHKIKEEVVPKQTREAVEPEILKEPVEEVPVQEIPTTVRTTVPSPGPSAVPHIRVQPLQKTSQIWSWIDDMLDDRFVDRLLLTLSDEQSALLLLVSARMATQKSSNQNELIQFNELARKVSASVEQAHGIGKRRDERKPPTMSQLSDISHLVTQLLLEPYSSILYQNNKGKLPANIKAVRNKFGIYEEEPEKEEIKKEAVQDTHKPKMAEKKIVNEEGILMPGLPRAKESPIEPTLTPEIILEPKVVEEPVKIQEPVADELEIMNLEDDEGFIYDDYEMDEQDELDDEFADKPGIDDDIPWDDEKFNGDDEDFFGIDENILDEDDEGFVIESNERIEEVEVDFLTFEIEDPVEEQNEPEIKNQEIEVDIVHDIDLIARDENLLVDARDVIVEQALEDESRRVKKSAEEVNLLTDTEGLINSGFEQELFSATEDQLLVQDQVQLDELALLKQEIENEAEDTFHVVDEGVIQNEAEPTQNPASTVSTLDLEPDVIPLPVHAEPEIEGSEFDAELLALMEELESEDQDVIIKAQEFGSKQDKPTDEAQPKDEPVAQHPPHELPGKNIGFLGGFFSFIGNVFGAKDSILAAEITEEPIEVNHDHSTFDGKPKIDEPIIDEPVIDEPDINEPVKDEPVKDEPVIDKPVIDEPVIDEPVTTEPVIDNQVRDLPVTDEPVGEELVIDEPVVHGLEVEAPVLQDPNETFKIIDEEEMDETEALHVKLEKEFREREYRNMMAAEPLLFKICSYINSWIEALFGRHWFLFLFISIFSYFVIQNCIDIFGDGKVSKKVKTIERTLVESKKTNSELNNKSNQSGNMYHQLKQTAANSQNQIYQVQAAIEALKGWEVNFNEYLTSLDGNMKKLQTDIEGLEIKQETLDREILEEQHKHADFEQENALESQAMVDIASMKSECKAELGRFLAELDALKSEKSRLEGEIKIEKLVAQNYAEKTQSVKAVQSESAKKLDKLRGQIKKESQKTTKIQNKLFEQKVVYQWLEANAYVSGESAEEIIQNQQAYLVEAIKKVPEFNLKHKQLLSDSETNQTEIESIRQKISELSRKLSKIETNIKHEEKENVLLMEVDKLDAELEVTKDYYAKRETEISTKLGTETAERGYSESSHETQKAKEEALRDQLDKLRNQVSTMEKKWEEADNKNIRLVSELEDRKTNNYMALMETESKVVHLTQSVRALRGETNTIDDLIEQANEFITELNSKYDLETTSNSRKSDTGKAQSQNSSLASKGRESKGSSRKLPL